MTKTYRLGAIGFAHMHINGLLDAFARLPNVEWVACADTVPAVPSLSQAPSTRAYTMVGELALGFSAVASCSKRCSRLPVAVL